MLTALLARLTPDRPVLLAGPTASGKSSLALAIAEAQGRSVVNADALQVFDGWRILTARPGPEELDRAEHLLYGHRPVDADYSVGAWLREVAPLLTRQPAPVVVGGTGLYFSALTEGLAEIPPIDTSVRSAARLKLAEGGPEALIAELDPVTRARIDLANPVRVRRAWEVARQTGRGMADWHAATGAPILPPERAHLLHLVAPKDWLASRIVRRLDAMLADGVLDEARAIAPSWHPRLASAKAIGAAEFVALARGEITEADALARTAVSTRQYAKRQRTWFRRRMASWTTLDAVAISAMLRDPQEHIGFVNEIGARGTLDESRRQTYDGRTAGTDDV
ncbi:MAG: tRNA (adenosine(37)-N6)-dimethylallyltransferase MiaA [Rhodobacteraceae bacterium]|nr:tRNA (adenosine(37)-N6)-dimethylallyltransferase MiaA [Paracoccaceae bacterium]